MATSNTADAAVGTAATDPGANPDATPALAAFRAETRAWLLANCPPEMRTPMASEDAVCWGGRKFRYSSTAQKLWLDRMAERGWTVPTWPRAYGGGGLGNAQAKVLAQELRALNCRPPLNSFGIWMLGPALLQFGARSSCASTLAWALPSPPPP